MKRYQNLKSIKPFYGKNKTTVILFILFTFIAGGIALTFPFAISEIIISLTGGMYGEVVKYAVILFAFVTGNLLFTLGSEYFYTKASAAVFSDIRKQTVYQIIAMNLSSVYEKGSGFFLERLNEDCREIGIVYLDIYKSFANLIINLGFIGYITVLNPLLGLVFGSGLVILVVLEQVRISHLLANKKKQKRAIEKVKANEAEILKGIKEIKGLNAKDAVIEKYSGINAQYMSVKKGREIYQSGLSHIIGFVKALTDLAILLFAALYLLPNGHAELAAVLVVYNYKGNIYDLIAGFARIKDYYVNGELAAKRVNDIIVAPQEEIDEFGSENTEGNIKSIEFKDVHFSYINGRPILCGVSFEVNEPGLIGFVGKSGSGKSTIFSLLTRFYRANSGSILINGKEIETLTEESLRGAITPVLQDPYIFNDTVYNNLLFARADATKQDIESACKTARIHDEILAMSSGYDTVIGENGATISGGQKQRLEIARAMLRNTEVMLFDEATSALDKKNLEKINDLLIELGKTKIILVIAHRLAVMRRCDKVIVLDEGKVIAAGSHRQLIDTSEYYNELFKKKSNEEPIAEKPA